MKYRLLKDLPTIKAGAIFQEITREVDGSKILKEYDSNNKNTMLVSEIKNFDEWFEEVEPTDSIHWKPKNGDGYFFIDSWGDVCFNLWNDKTVDSERLALGFIYRTEEECRKARERKLAEVRLQQTSDFKPDFENGEGGWIVGYDYEDGNLATIPISDVDYGKPVRYATSEDARKSIKENREDWLKYFGIKEK
jgi:hypothetical protein